MDALTPSGYGQPFAHLCFCTRFLCLNLPRLLGPGLWLAPFRILHVPPWMFLAASSSIVKTLCINFIILHCYSVHIYPENNVW